jgi:hypothetical protein
MPRISVESLVELSNPVFGLDLERDRFQTLSKELETVLAEVMKLRELDLHDLDPAVIFDPETSYRDEHHG